MAQIEIKKYKRKRKHVENFTMKEETITEKENNTEAKQTSAILHF